MGGLYWKVRPDGASWRCTECKEEKTHKQVIITEHTETRKRKLLCLDCVDEEWLKEATCLGSL